MCRPFEGLLQKLFSQLYRVKFVFYPLESVFRSFLSQFLSVMEEFETPAKRQKLREVETHDVMTGTDVLPQLHVDDFSTPTKFSSLTPSSSSKKVGRPTKPFAEHKNAHYAVRKMEQFLRSECKTEAMYHSLLQTLVKRAGVEIDFSVEERLKILNTTAAKLTQRHVREMPVFRQVLVSTLGTNIPTSELATCFNVSQRTIQRDKAADDEIAICKHDRIIKPDNFEVCVFHYFNEC